MKRLYIIRHGRTQDNIDNKIIGFAPSPLRQESIQEIKKIVEKIKNIAFNHIETSDLKRAVQTAEICKQVLEDQNLEIKQIKELREVNYGILTGMKKEEAKSTFPKYHKDIFFKHEQGESFQELYERITKHIETVEENKTILMITHAGGIRALYSYFNNEEFQKNIEMKIKHESILLCEEIKGEKSAKFL